jgi:hypothetical protein
MKAASIWVDTVCGKNFYESRPGVIPHGGHFPNSVRAMIVFSISLVPS